MDFLAMYHWHSLAIIKIWFGCPCWGLVISPFLCAFIYIRHDQYIDSDSQSPMLHIWNIYQHVPTKWATFVRCFIPAWSIPELASLFFFYWFLHMGVSENSVPLNPMVFLILIPFLNGYFIGNINPTFSDIPISPWLDLRWSSFGSLWINTRLPLQATHSAGLWAVGQWVPVLRVNDRRSSPISAD